LIRICGLKYFLLLKMLSSYSVIIVIIIVIVAVFVYFLRGKSISLKSGICISKKHFDLQNAMRKLWTDHVWWTREFIISKLENPSEIDSVTSRLIQNQKDIGSAMTQFYGEKPVKQWNNYSQNIFLLRRT
jgi:hypothetical protein